MIGNDDDNYYLQGCRKFTFPELIYYDIYRKGFRNVYYINDYSENDLFIMCFNKPSKSMIIEESRNVFERFGTILTMEMNELICRNDVKEEQNEEYIYIKDLNIRMDIEKALNSLIRVYNKSDIKHKTAVFISGKVLSHIYNLDIFKHDFSKGIKELKNKDNNIFGVVFSPDGDSIKEWITPKEKNYDISEGILGLSIFQSELSAVFTQEKQCFTFPIDAICNAKKEHFVFFNTFEKEELDNFLEYYFLKNSDIFSLDIMSQIDWIASLIWAWYNVDCFRNICRFKLKDNPYRRYDVIAESLDNDTISDIKEYIRELEEKNKGMTSSRFFDSIKNSTKNTVGNKVFYSERPYFVEIIYEIEHTAFELAKEHKGNIVQSKMWKAFQNIEKNISRIYCTKCSFDSYFDIEGLVGCLKKIFDCSTTEDEERILAVIDDGNVFEIMNIMISDYYEQIGKVKQDDLKDVRYEKLSKAKVRIYDIVIKLMIHIYHDPARRKDKTLVGYLMEAKNQLSQIRNYMNNERNSEAKYNSLLRNANEIVNKINIRISDNNSYNL